MAEHIEEVVLETRNLYVGYYKDLNILQDLNIKARKNQITAILGANGVGKSTALKAVFGFLRPNEGEILLQGESIVDVPTHKRILKGLAYIPQQPGVLKDMSVEENLQLGGWTFKRDRMQIREVYVMLTVLTEQDDLTILLVDQEIRYALKIADYVYVLELGRNKFEGISSEFDDLEKAFWVA